MRIISGRFARKHITAPSSLPVRPTTDFAKTGLFNILANRFNFEDITALDLFAGTGNISYEFYSRGVSSITCVDKSQACTKFISATFKSLGASAIEVITTDSLQFLKSCTHTYDIIFADPPYNYTNYEDLIEIVFSNKILKPNGLLVIEHGNSISFKNAINLKEQRKYGAVNFSFFETD